MKVIVSRAELLGLIGKLQGIVPSRPSVPILGNVLLVAMDDQLIISATDLSLSMRCYISARVVEEGGITLPAKRLFPLIRELATPQVEIHATTPEIAFVNAGSSHFKIQGILKSEFPDLPNMEEGTACILPNAVLKEMLQRTAFAAARDETRQALQGLLLQHLNNVMTCVGTDGKRLAKIYAPTDSKTEQPVSYVLPLKSAEEMVKLLEAKEESCRLILMPDKIALEMGSCMLITKLLADPYPDVMRIIPEKKSAPVALHREELISLLRQVSLFTSDTSSSVRFSFAPGTLHLTAMSGEIGEGNVSMPANYAGPKLEVAFNAHNFLDVLRHSKDETVDLFITDPYNPSLITDSSNALFVVMPMRLDAY